MRAAVRDAFVAFTTKFEGKLNYMYLDVKGLVTTGIGNLIDPIGAALGLPWLKEDGSAASQDEVTQEWNTIKSRTDLDQRGGGAFKSVSTLHLSDDAISNLVWGKADQNETILKQRYPDFDNLPADAQLALHSMAWAMGPAFNFPALAAAVNSSPPDFATAAQQCEINSAGNPGVVPRNQADQLLFGNAAKVVASSGDLDKLWWPDTAPDSPPPATLAQGGTTPAAKLTNVALVLLLAGGSWALLHFVLGPQIARATKNLADRHAERLASMPPDVATGGAPA